MEKNEIKESCNCNGERDCLHDCSCSEHECNCNDEPIVIEMEDVNGEKVKVEIIGTFDDAGKSYAIANDLDNTDNSYIFQVQTTEQGDMLVSIDDEKEFDRLCKVVEKLVG